MKKPCDIERCEGRATRRGLCNKHYQRKLKGARMVDPLPGFKWCRGCDNDLPDDEDHFPAGRSRCHSCETERRSERWHEKIKGSDQERRREARRAQSKRERRLIHVYGMTEDEYQARKKAQGGRCAICDRKRKLVIDHCHDSGEVRGLLCSQCNAAIGLLDDSPELVELALGYLCIAEEVPRE